ncbi:unnamed protein product, partial [Effrenium voratum]
SGSDPRIDRLMARLLTAAAVLALVHTSLLFVPTLRPARAIRAGAALGARGAPSGAPPRAEGSNAYGAAQASQPLLCALALVLPAIRRARTARTARTGARTVRRAWPWEEEDPYAKCTALKLQIGMQFSKNMLTTLNKLADTADTSSDAGLHQLMLDVVLAIKRAETSWRYASCDFLLFDAEDEGRAAGAKLQRWGLEAQEKWGDGDWDKDKGGGVTEYLVVTLMLSCYGAILGEEKEAKIRSMSDVKRVLGSVSEVQEDELLQLDVQWIPEEEGDSLSAMEVTMKFPELVMICVGLSTTATSLLFKLSRKMTQEEFLIELHRLCGQWHQKPYDFVHLPWAKLAVVNFISHEACASFFNMVKALAGLPGIGLTDVREALHQGLAANLGHFCAKCRQMSVYENAPLVFVDGATVPLALACQILVDSQLHAARSEPGARKQDFEACGYGSKCGLSRWGVGVKGSAVIEL